MDTEKFLMLHSHYPEDSNENYKEFNRNLQDFALQVGYICALETGKKMPPGEAYSQVKELWRQLKQDYKKFRKENGLRIVKD